MKAFCYILAFVLLWLGSWGLRMIPRRYEQAPDGTVLLLSAMAFAGAGCMFYFAEITPQ